MLVSVGDIRLFVDVDGAKLVPDGDVMRERPTIVMLHGNGVDHSPFKEFLAPFTDFAQVVYVDLRGHGRSGDGEPGSWNLDQWADDLVALCDALGIDRPVVYGLSFGGNITLNYAIRYPDRPAKIIVVSCAARINPEASIRMFERLGGPDIGAEAARFYAAPADTWDEFLPVGGPYFSQRLRRPDVGARIVAPHPGVTEHMLRHEYLQHDYRDRVAAIRCPTLLLGGELDPLVPIQEIEDMASRMQPGVARVVRIPDAGHGGGPSAAVIDLLREFVAGDA
jgi:pimeloyl-ACP methyl ester carboxylesterase